MSDAATSLSSYALKLHQLLLYAALALPLAFAGMPLYMHVPDFYATEYGLSLTALGSILLLIRLFDAVQDPLIGVYSDKYAAYRSRILGVSILLLAVGFWALFHPPAGIAVEIWFAVNLVITTTAFSVITINFSALGGIWTENQRQQTRIATMREAFGLIGLMLAAATPSFLQQHFSAGMSYHYLAVIMIVALVLASLLFYRWYQRHAAAQDKAQSVQTAQLWQLGKILKQFRRFYLIYGLSVLASSIPAVLFLFFVRDRLQAEAEGGYLLLFYFLMGVLAMPAWSFLARKTSPQLAWLGSMALAVTAFFWAYLLGAGDIEAFAVVCALSGMALGAELALPQAILAQWLTAHHKQAEATRHYAAIAFLTKMALALAAGVILPLLESSGYRPAEQNTEAALMMLSFYYALIPCLIKIIAGVLLLTWLFDRNEGEANENTHERSHNHDHM
jgi:GPH family glycoside/pentoside/hexuronide:cation symporter